MLFLTLSEREKRKIYGNPGKLRCWLNGEEKCMVTYQDNARGHALFMRRIFLTLGILKSYKNFVEQFCLELIFVNVRGNLMNPLSMSISDLVNKYSGSVPLYNTLNTMGVTYSYHTYRRIRAQLIQQEVSIHETFPMPSFDPNVFHFLTIGINLFG